MSRGTVNLGRGGSYSGRGGSYSGRGSPYLARGSPYSGLETQDEGPGDEGGIPLQDLPGKMEGGGEEE